MKGAANNKSISSALILGGLWFINILIVLFGFPFLIYKKIQELLTKNPPKFEMEVKKDTNPKSNSYAPRHSNSKF